jgi:hypothetical protein
MGEPEIDDLREAYEHVGLGVSPALVKLFRPALGDWCTTSLTWGNRLGRPHSLPVDDLFTRSIPSDWDVTGAEVRSISARRSKRREFVNVVVHGVLRARAHGAWDVWTVPFVHIWTMTRGEVTKVMSYLDGIEICRCAAA